MTVYSGKLGLEKMAKDYGIRMEALVRRTAFELAALVIERTPVDTGFARGGWFAQLNGIGPWTPYKDPAGVGAANFISATLASYAPGDTIYVMNPTKYIRALEYGHSKQAPSGMVRRTLAEGKLIADGIAQRLMAGSFA